MMRIGPFEEISEGDFKIYQVEGESWIVARVDDRLVAVMDRCGHIPQSMNDFGLSGSRITCGHHGVTYDITTGEIVDDVGFVDVKPLRSGRCEVRDGDLYIETGGTD